MDSASAPAAATPYASKTPAAAAIPGIRSSLSISAEA